MVFQEETIVSYNKHNEAAGAGRTVPHNLDAEKSVLSAMTLTLEGTALTLQLLKPDYFHRLEHQELFIALSDLFTKNILGDVVTIVDHLSKKGRLSQAGGASLVSEIVGFAATPAHLEHHISIVREKALLRSLIQTSTSIITDCYSVGADLTILLDQVERKVFEITQVKIERDFVPIKDLIQHSIEKAEQLYSLKNAVTGVSSGFSKVDQMTSGLQPSDMIVLAARPSMGKTAMALNVVEHVALNEQKSVGIFSLEMSKEQVVFRLLCSHARISSQKIRSGYLKKEDFPKLENAYSRLRTAPIYVDDTPGISVMELRAKARRLKARSNCQLLIIDYLQLMTSGTHSSREGRQQEISEISRSVKGLARELNVPIIILSQLNRAVENRTDHRPQLSDLRESGAIEQDADVVFLLTRKEYYNKDDEPGMADLILAKQRNGPTGEIKLHWSKDYTRFENLSLTEEDAFMDMENGHGS